MDVGRVAVDNLPPVMRHDEEAIQHAESQRRHGEEIHCCDGFTMDVQKRTPSFCRLGIARMRCEGEDGDLTNPIPLRYNNVRRLSIVDDFVSVNASKHIRIQ